VVWVEKLPALGLFRDETYRLDAIGFGLQERKKSSQCGRLAVEEMLQPIFSVAYGI